MVLKNSKYNSVITTLKKLYISMSRSLLPQSGLTGLREEGGGGRSAYNSRGKGGMRGNLLIVFFLFAYKSFACIDFEIITT